MTLCNRLIIALWLVLIAYWVVSAGGVKRNIGGVSVWRREIGLRLGVLVLVLLALRISIFCNALRIARSYAVNTSTDTDLLGVVFCAFGVGLAIFARVHLGRNWGMPMSRKDNPELVTTGPYAFVRHPIYAGILLATLGSTIGQKIFWLVPLIVFEAYFIYSAQREEKRMIGQFQNSTRRTCSGRRCCCCPSCYG